MTEIGRMGEWMMLDKQESKKEINQGDIVIYQTEDGSAKIDVRFVDYTVWLT